MAAASPPPRRGFERGGLRCAAIRCRYTPKRDRDATFADVALCVDEVRPAWGASGALRNPRPDDYSRLSPEAAAALVEWAKAAVRAT